MGVSSRWKYHNNRLKGIRQKLDLQEEIIEDKHHVLETVFPTLLHKYLDGYRYLELSVLGRNLTISERIGEKHLADLSLEHRKLVIAISQYEFFNLAGLCSLLKLPNRTGEWLKWRGGSDD